MMGVKMVGQGLAVWANENQGRFPMEVSVTAGGTKEHALEGELLPSILIAAKYVDANMLLCPSDQLRQAATNFAQLKTTNISYFLNIAAIYTNQTQIVAGDRDVTIRGSLVPPGLLTISNPSNAGWGNLLHKGGGNVALADGSAHMIDSRQFRNHLITGPLNRLIIP